MKAIVYSKHGSPDVLQLKEVEKPIPKENQLLIKVHAASLNALDSHMMRDLPYVTSINGAGGGVAHFRKPQHFQYGSL